MTIALIFAEWAREIQAELEESRQALGALTEALHEAEVIHAEAQERHHAIQAAVAALRGGLLSHELASYLRGVDEDRHTTESAMTRARVDVAGARDRIADLQQAARELELLMSPPESEENQGASIHAA